MFLTSALIWLGEEYFTFHLWVSVGHCPEFTVFFVCDKSLCYCLNCVLGKLAGFNWRMRWSCHCRTNVYTIYSITVLFVQEK